MFRPVIDELVTAAFKNIAPYFLMGIHVDDKSNGTPVTQADKSTERLLRGLIAERFPMHGIFGEEYGVEEAKGEWPRYRWILDPIDGTRASFLPQRPFRKENEKIRSGKKNGGQTKFIAVSAVFPFFILLPLFLRTR